MLQQQPINEQQLMALDPGYESWSQARMAENEQEFDRWLKSPEGERWLSAHEFEIEARKQSYGYH